MAVDKAYANAYKFERRIQLAVLRQLMVFYCLTLHNDFGFGKKRLLRFLANAEELSCVRSRGATLEEMNQTIIDETGIDVLARAQVISMPPDGSE